MAHRYTEYAYDKGLHQFTFDLGDVLLSLQIGFGFVRVELLVQSLRLSGFLVLTLETASRYFS